MSTFYPCICAKCGAHIPHEAFLLPHELVCTDIPATVPKRDLEYLVAVAIAFGAITRSKGAEILGIGLIESHRWMGEYIKSNKEFQLIMETIRREEQTRVDKKINKDLLILHGTELEDE